LKNRDDDFEIVDGVLVKYNGNASIVVIPDSVLKIRDYCFFKHNEIYTLVIRGSEIEIGVGAFSQCCGLRVVSIPYAKPKIGEGAFAGCVRLPLTNISIPNGTAELGVNAYQYCPQLSIDSFSNPVAFVGFGVSILDACTPRIGLVPFLMPLAGLILSSIGLYLSTKRMKKCKGFAVAGIIISSLYLLYDLLSASGIV
jgi:hypothetical protein